MLVIHGTYHWGRKLVAYRRDYCVTCASERVAFQHRTFDALHMFWLPILPLGFWKRWHCSACGRDPHASPRTRKSLKWAGVAILVLMAASAWAVSPREKPDDAMFIWAMRLGGPLAAGWALRATLNSPTEVNLKERLRSVQPILDVNCPLCGVVLVPEEPAWRCPQCGIRRGALKAV